MFRIELQPAYVIHTRPYRDTSFIVELLTPEHGRIGCIARGVRQRKTGRRALLNPFIPLLVSAQGKANLKLLTHLEASGSSQPLTGRALFSGLYLNELIQRLLPEWDAHPEIFRDYCDALAALERGEPIEPVLRAFEGALLQALGYGISWRLEADGETPIRPDAYYRLVTDSGFVPVVTRSDPSGLVAGYHLLAAAERNWQDPETARAAKHIHRRLLAPLLGARPLKSRDLFG